MFIRNINIIQKYKMYRQALAVLIQQLKSTFTVTLWISMLFFFYFYSNASVMCSPKMSLYTRYNYQKKVASRPEQTKKSRCYSSTLLAF